MSWQGMARRVFRSGPSLLLLALLGACALPLNTAVQDWSQTAGIAVTRPGPAAPESADAARAMQGALSTYFHALGVLWDGAELPFDAAPFAGWAAEVPDPAASEAIVALGRLLRAASDEKPPRWLPRDNSGPTPAYEDLRIYHIVPAADGSVQILLAALSPLVGAAEAAAPLASAGNDTSDPALRQALLEREASQARHIAEQRPARARQVAVLTVIAESHAMLAARGDVIRQRSTELQLRAAEDRLIRAMTERRAPTTSPATAAGS